MLTISQLSQSRQKILKEVVDKAIVDVNTDNFKIIKDTLNKAFGEENNQILKPTVEILLSTLEGIYGATQVINLNEHTLRSIANQSANIHAVIHFPKVTITNSKKKTHDITDLWVRVNFQKDGRLASTIYGLRSSASNEEMVSQYFHSHLPNYTWDKIRWESFCTGTGQINQVIGLLRNNFSATNFGLFCAHLKSYVAWESLEGNPYRRISDIGLPRGVTATVMSSSVAKTVAEYLLVEFKQNPKELLDLINVRIDSKGAIITPGEKLPKRLAEIICTWRRIGDTGLSNIEQALARRDSNGKYHSITSSTVTVNYQKTPIFKFKEKDIYFEPSSKKYEISKEHYANPKIVQEFCNRIQGFLTRSLLLKYSGATK